MLEGLRIWSKILEMCERSHDLSQANKKITRFSRFTKWQLCILLKITAFFHPGPFWVNMVVSLWISQNVILQLCFSQLRWVMWSIPQLGSFHLVALTIRELKSHMICYKFKCWWKINFQSECFNFNQWEDLNFNWSCDF